MRIRRDALDILFSQYIRLLADNHCEYCGRYESNLQCSHFHSRRKANTRYDPDNCCGLCFSCHRFLGENPYAHTEFFKKRLGSERFEELNTRAEVITRCSKKDKEKMKADLTAKIKLLKEGG